MIQSETEPSGSPKESLYSVSTYHDQADKVDPVPERVRVLNEVHDISPALQSELEHCTGPRLVRCPPIREQYLTGLDQ